MAKAVGLFLSYPRLKSRGYSVVTTYYF